MRAAALILAGLLGALSVIGCADGRGRGPLPRDIAVRELPSGERVSSRRAASMYLVRRAQESVRARRWEDARLWLTEASDVDATNPWAYHLLGLIAFDRRDYVQAEALFQKASLHFRDAGEWEVECALLRGIAAEHVGRWYAARDAFQQAARLDPQNARAKRGLGNALRRIERLERRK